ncbi:ABC transporter substrate-binding protein [Bradyrhizobium sp. GCM10027634]|uniref:ABC transporter substrate-binding protein n=1 Tax=unclassified Bradyrhizobium TaxID=2631580 RepID=UPI00263B5695|nr:ABC transporter substrate-binding protein [Bradyrhizobium sp. WYCCWR 12677]MDN5001282.1 ABC transporter substrate-binding protein [Bradyrhizobium sp. WYCCWR 12677]
MAQSILSVLRPISLVYADATGSFLVLLTIAQQQGLFEKHGLEIHAVATRGAIVPRVTRDVPVGLIGEPAAILQAAEGSDLRIVASFSRTLLSGHLVGRPDIQDASELRGKRIGVRVLGAGIWISTVLALEQLRLSPSRDEITLVPIGSPVEILRALEEGAIDAALLPAAQTRRLKKEGYHVLLDDYPGDITAYGGGLVVTAAYLKSHPELVEKLIIALVEALAFCLAEKNSLSVMEAFRTSLSIADEETVRTNLRELKPRPYPSRFDLADMRRVMSLHDARVLDVGIDQLVDDRLVQKLDREGTIGHLHEVICPD